LLIAEHPTTRSEENFRRDPMRKPIETATLRTTLVALCALLAPAAAACGGADPASTSETTESRDLELTTKTPTSVAGRFTKEGATIAFQIDREGTAKHVRMATTAGAPLVDSMIRTDGHTTHVLGDRLVVESVGGKPPTYTGDRAAEKALHELPESKCIENIESALAAAGVDAALLPSEREDGTGPKLQSVGFGNCGAWIPEYGSATCGTTFFGWTGIYVTNCNWDDVWFNFNGEGGHVISGTHNPNGGCNGWDSTPVNANGCASCNYGGWWWGANVNFQNIVGQDAYSGQYGYGLYLYYGHGTGH
jgi:hypothetical protein